MKLNLQVLGCPKNDADMSNFRGIMSERGHEFVDNPLNSDVVVIDTCGFIEAAKLESIESILSYAQLKERNPALKVVAVGCLVQRYFNDLKKEIPEIDGLISVTSPKRLADLIEKGELWVHDQPEAVYEFTSRCDALPYAFVKVGDGCDRACAFCSIPSFKGRSRSRHVEDVFNEVRTLVSKGTKEIVLVSQDTTQYGLDIYGKQALPELLEAIDRIPQDFWVRVMYLHPDHLTSRVIDAIGSSEHTLPYYDVPVQSGSDRILSGMDRTRNSSELVSLFRGIRRRIPEAVIRTTLMVGFPGETRESFEQSLEFAKAVGFNWLGGFVYSPEEGTTAFSRKVTMSRERAQNYLNELLLEQDEISHLLNLRHVGKHKKALIDERVGGVLVGRLYDCAPEIDGSVILSGNASIGDFVNCTITAAEVHDTRGVVNADAKSA